MRLRLRPRKLPVGPAVQGFLPEPAHLFDDAPLGFVGARQIASAVSDDLCKRLHATFQASMAVEHLKQPGIIGEHIAMGCLPSQLQLVVAAS